MLHWGLLGLNVALEPMTHNRPEHAMKPKPTVNKSELTVTAPEGWAFESGILHERVCHDASELIEATAEFVEFGEPCTDASCDWCHA